MKKIIALILAGLMIVSLAACGMKKEAGSSGEKPAAGQETSEEAAEDKQEAVVGGYTKMDDMSVTDEIRDLVAKATEKMTGADYEAVAFIAKQIVSGTNYLILCRITPVTKDPVAKYALVTIYEDLQGSASVSEVLESTAEAGIPNLMGGWNEPDSPAMTEEAAEALAKATEGLVGAEYTPAALISRQIVSGTNYCILCEIKTVTPDAAAKYALVYVYADLQGNAEITEVVEFGANA